MAPALSLTLDSRERMMNSGLYSALLALQLGGGASGSFLPFAIQLVAIFGIFYFLLIRPQQQQKRKHEDALTKIKRGDRIVTAGGIIAEIVHIRESVPTDGKKSSPLEDEVTIKSAESRLIIERGRIVKVIGVSASTERE